MNHSLHVIHSDEVTVRVLKHDGTEYRRWYAEIARQDGPLIVLEGQFDADVSHHLLGKIKRGTRTVEYYWLDRWYNIFRFLRADGSTRFYYCNINTPPTLSDAVLSYVDLDIDVLAHPDLSFEVLDLHEFEENSERYHYSSKEKMNARSALDELIGLIRAHQFPFTSSLTDARDHLSGNINSAD